MIRMNKKRKVVTDMAAMSFFLGVRFGSPIWQHHPFFVNGYIIQPIRMYCQGKDRFRHPKMRQKILQESHITVETFSAEIWLFKGIGTGEGQFPVDGKKSAKESSLLPILYYSFFSLFTGTGMRSDWSL